MPFEPRRPSDTAPRPRPDTTFTKTTFAVEPAAANGDCVLTADEGEFVECYATSIAGPVAVTVGWSKASS